MPAPRIVLLPVSPPMPGRRLSPQGPPPCSGRPGA
jgi:hypothetical protein